VQEAPLTEYRRGRVHLLTEKHNLEPQGSDKHVSKTCKAKSHPTFISKLLLSPDLPPHTPTYWERPRHTSPHFQPITMPNTRRSAAQPLPPAGQTLAENGEARKNQGQKKADDSTECEAHLMAESTPLAYANPPTVPLPPAQKKRGRKAVVTASDDEDDASRNKKAKNATTGTTNTRAALVKAGAARKSMKAQTQAAAKEAKQQASQTRLDNAKRNLAQIQVDEDQRRARLTEESIHSLPTKRGKRSAQEMEEPIDDDDEGALVEAINQNIVSICLLAMKEID